MYLDVLFDFMMVSLYLSSVAGFLSISRVLYQVEVVSPRYDLSSPQPPKEPERNAESSQESRYIGSPSLYDL